MVPSDKPKAETLISFIWRIAICIFTQRAKYALVKKGFPIIEQRLKICYLFLKLNNNYKVMYTHKYHNELIRCKELTYKMNIADQLGIYIKII